MFCVQNLRKRPTHGSKSVFRYDEISRFVHRCHSDIPLRPCFQNRQRVRPIGGKMLQTRSRDNLNHGVVLTRAEPYRKFSRPQFHQSFATLFGRTVLQVQARNASSPQGGQTSGERPSDLIPPPEKEPRDRRRNESRLRSGGFQALRERRPYLCEHCRAALMRVIPKQERHRRIVERRRKNTEERNLHGIQDGPLEFEKIRTLLLRRRYEIRNVRGAVQTWHRTNRFRRALRNRHADTRLTQQIREDRRQKPAGTKGQ